MKYIITIFTLIYTQILIAGINQAPPPFDYKDGKAVWVDFKTAYYELEYDVKKKSAWATTTINFEALESGYPIFDSVQKPERVWIDGVETDAALVNLPEGVSRVRIVQSSIEPGSHTLKIRTRVDNGTKFRGVGRSRNVSSGFFIKDLKDRLFLEKYVPSNYEYDQYQMTFNVQIIGSKKSHNIFANGEVEELGKNKFQVTYPESYTSSAVLFHLVPLNKFKRTYFDYTSIDGRKIPVIIYSSYWIRNWRMYYKSRRVLRELEEDYGPWPHSKVIIYGTKLRGGMEYAGATVSSLVSLGHELQHSYFAKGIFPANGNSGWMDEAIASWRDEGHQSTQYPNYASCNLAAHSPYQRKTDDRSYARGRSFIAYLDYTLKSVGLPGMKAFLRDYFVKRKFTTVTTEDFRSDLEAYSGLDLKEDFKQYIYGGNDIEELSSHSDENPHHPEITDEQLESII